MGCNTASFWADYYCQEMAFSGTCYIASNDSCMHIDFTGYTSTLTASICVIPEEIAFKDHAVCTFL